MERMIVKHITGSKANQVEEFALRYHNELTFGRDPSAMVKYDPDRDDLVGREHARITRDPNDPEGFIINDMGSRNGTFVNKQRIIGLARLQPGDTVQFGQGGPEFQFDVEPRPSGAIKATRVAELVSPAPAAPATRVMSAGTGASAADNSAAPTGANAKTSVGKATVERMISHNVTETKKQQGRKFAVIGGAAALALLLLFGAVIGGTYWYSSSKQAAMQAQLAQQEEEIKRKAEEAKREAEQRVADLNNQLVAEKNTMPKVAAEVADKNHKAVVQIQAIWKLMDTANQTQAYHLHLPQVLAFKIATRDATLKGMIVGPSIPVYVQTLNGQSYEPVLVADKGAYNINRPIGANVFGSGFVVSEDGFILTNRHVAAGWKSAYQFPGETAPGIVLSPDYSTIVAAGVQPPRNWVPANSLGNGGVLGALGIRVKKPADYTGDNFGLKVILSGRDREIEGRLVEPSDTHDVALIRIDRMGGMTKVEINDNYDSLKKGEEVVVMGYPAMTAPQYGIVPSQDMFNPTTQLKEIANPTVTPTWVSNIIRGTKQEDGTQVVSPIVGDVLQLATGSTGSGNSGGPVFDMQGRVIGIFFAGSVNNDIRYAVPIRYGKKLFE
ncbi:MAG TPA: trypsin-like peptidase domain-containing protein [Pyrinomonadaceae bacterium]|jgi:S1-C subfamily serine protease